VTDCQHRFGAIARDDGDGRVFSECPKCHELIGWVNQGFLTDSQNSLIEVVTSVVGVVAWAESLIPGNIEAQKVVDELNAVFARRKP
jgi:hypothetical protein